MIDWRAAYHFDTRHWDFQRSRVDTDTSSYATVASRWPDTERWCHKVGSLYKDWRIRRWNRRVCLDIQRRMCILLWRLVAVLKIEIIDLEQVKVSQEWMNLRSMTHPRSNGSPLVPGGQAHFGMWLVTIHLALGWQSHGSLQRWLRQANCVGQSLSTMHSGKRQAL